MTVIIEGIVGSLIAGVFAWVRNRLVKNDLQKEVSEAIEVAVDKTWIDYVRQAKKDETFSGKKARAYAKVALIEVASKNVLKVVKAWGPDVLTSIIHRVANRKAKK